MITDREYPSLPAHAVLSKLVDEFLVQNPEAGANGTAVSFQDLKRHLVESQNPEEVSSIMKIQRELDETKVILHKTIESVRCCCHWHWPCPSIMSKGPLLLTNSTYLSLHRSSSAAKRSTTSSQRAVTSACRASGFSSRPRSKTRVAWSCNCNQPACEYSRKLRTAVLAYPACLFVCLVCWVCVSVCELCVLWLCCLASNLAVRLPIWFFFFPLGRTGNEPAFVRM